LGGATLTSKGQTTIPKDVREAMALQPGDRIDFHVLSDTSATMRVRRGGIKDFIGIVGRPGRTPVTVADMDAAIANEIRRRHAPKRK
jgi:AbrB family looped-hinge helix DNA binding protein